MRDSFKIPMSSYTKCDCDPYEKWIKNEDQRQKYRSSGLRIFYSFLSAIGSWIGIMLMLMALRAFSLEWYNIFDSLMTESNPAEEGLFEEGLLFSNTEDKEHFSTSRTKGSYLSHSLAFLYGLILAFETIILLGLTFLFAAMCYKKSLVAMKFGSESQSPSPSLHSSVVWIVTGLFLYTLIELLLVTHRGVREVNGNWIFYNEDDPLLTDEIIATSTGQDYYWNQQNEEEMYDTTDSESESISTQSTSTEDMFYSQEGNYYDDFYDEDSPLINGTSTDSSGEEFTSTEYDDDSDDYHDY